MSFYARRAFEEKIGSDGKREKKKKSFRSEGGTRDGRKRNEWRRGIAAASRARWHVARVRRHIHPALGHIESSIPRRMPASR